MKGKLSVTLDAGLVRFLDALPGKSRSAKLEQVIRRYKRVTEEQALRLALARHSESEAEQVEREAWIRTMEQDQWSESGEETSGPSSSSRIPSPGQR